MHVEPHLQVLQLALVQSRHQSEALHHTEAPRPVSPKSSIQESIVVPDETRNAAGNTYNEHVFQVDISNRMFAVYTCCKVVRIQSCEM